MTFINLHDNLKLNKHKPYECRNCRGTGQEWDRITQNTDICCWCDGDGRMDTPFQKAQRISRKNGKFNQ